jgi:hypothetical protein
MRVRTADAADVGEMRGELAQRLAEKSKIFA